MELGNALKNSEDFFENFSAIGYEPNKFVFKI
jgi:hypothetical protein